MTAREQILRMAKYTDQIPRKLGTTRKLARLSASAPVDICPTTAANGASRLPVPRWSKEGTVLILWRPSCIDSRTVPIVSISNGHWVSLHRTTSHIGLFAMPPAADSPPGCLGSDPVLSIMYPSWSAVVISLEGTSRAVECTLRIRRLV